MMIIINGDTLSSISKIKNQNVHSTVAPLILSGALYNQLHSKHYE